MKFFYLFSLQFSKTYWTTIYNTIFHFGVDPKSNVHSYILLDKVRFLDRNRPLRAVNNTGKFWRINIYTSLSNLQPKKTYWNGNFECGYFLTDFIYLRIACLCRIIFPFHFKRVILAIVHRTSLTDSDTQRRCSSIVYPSLRSKSVLLVFQYCSHHKPESTIFRVPCYCTFVHYFFLRERTQ